MEMIPSNQPPKYKYKILEFMDEMPYRKRKKAMAYFPKMIGKSRTTVGNYINCRMDSPQQIPSTILSQFEDFFDVPPRGLNNFDIDPFDKNELS